MSENLGNTQPNIAVKKSWRGSTILFNALGLIVILFLAILAGYGSGISVRRDEMPSNAWNISLTKNPPSLAHRKS
jgi:hypothetical protein